MRIETRYGYLIDALRRYPFDKEIKERIEILMKTGISKVRPQRILPKP